MATRNSIAGARPELVARESLLKARANALGIDYRIADFGGVRTEADTVLIMAYRLADYAAAVAANPSLVNTPINVWRPIAPFGSSLHNYGAAFDVLITKAPSGMSFDTALSRLKALAPSVGLSSSVPNDPPHFQLPITLNEARDQWGNASSSNTADVAAASSAFLVVGVTLALIFLRRRRSTG